MTYRILPIAVPFAFLLLSGCGTAKIEELSQQLERLEGENQRLALENERLRSDLVAVRVELESAKNQVAQRGSGLSGLAAGLLQNPELLQKIGKDYGKLLGIAKDMGIHELDGVPGDIDNLLQGVLGEGGAEDDGAGDDGAGEAKDE